MKNNITGLPHIIVVQTTSMVLAATAGPAALAIFSRPLALCNIISRLVRQYATLLTPVAGGLHGLKRHDEMKAFFLSSLRFSIAIATPPLVMLGGYGDVIIGFWMNEGYVVPWLCPLVSAAFFLSTSHSPAMRILAGIDAHGRVAVRSLVMSLIVYAIALTMALATGFDAISAAIVVGASLSVGPGLTVIISACKKFEVGLLEYLRNALLPPLICNLPLLAVVLLSRFLYPEMSLPHAALWGSAGGGIVLLFYWLFLLASEDRANITKRIARFNRS